MGQPLRALAALAKDTSSFPNIHTGQIKTTYDSSYGDLLSSMGVGHIHGTHTYTQIIMHTQKIKVNTFF